MTTAEPILTPFTWRRPATDAKESLRWVDDRFAGPSPMPEDCRGPFGIDKSERKETRWLVAVNQLAWEKYEPLSQHPELFRTFIDTESTEVGYLSFAQRYGMLGVESTLDRGISEFGEALYLWRKEQATIRAANRVAAALRRQQTGILETWFRSTEKKGYKLSGDLMNPAFLPTGVGVLGRWETSILPKPAIWVAHDALSNRSQRIRLIARVWLARQVNRRLDGHQGSTSAVVARVLPFEAEGLPIHLSPNSLLAALWLQLVESINGNRTFKRCKHCKRWFLASPEGVGLKSHAKYCSPNCRLRAWRNSGSKKKKRGR
jgi:hypothetical protein